jgi:hypothetical protein
MTLQEQDYETLKQLLLNGPVPHLDVAVRGRLALYRLIDETPRGWRITANGKTALRTAEVQSEIQEYDKQARDPNAPRNYKKRPRDTSWID